LSDLEKVSSEKKNALKGLSKLNLKSKRRPKVIRLYDCVQESSEPIKTVIILLQNNLNYKLCFGILKKVKKNNPNAKMEVSQAPEQNS